MLALLAAVVLTTTPQRPPTAPPLVPLEGPAQPNPTVPPEPEGAVEDDLGERPQKEHPGGQFGVVGLLGATVDIGIRTRAESPLAPATTGPAVIGLGATLGIGLRYGFFQRTMARQWMPAVAVMAGSGIATDGFSPFVEARFEYLTVSPGGPLQPNFTVSGSTGLTLNRFTRGGPNGVRPHVGLGVGWNWWPKGGGTVNWSGFVGSGGGLGHPAALLVVLLAVPVVLGIAAMVFAGRVEVRYTARPVIGPGSDFVSVVLGVGG